MLVASFFVLTSAYRCFQHGCEKYRDSARAKKAAFDAKNADQNAPNEQIDSANKKNDWRKLLEDQNKLRDLETNTNMKGSANRPLSTVGQSNIGALSRINSTKQSVINGHVNNNNNYGVGGDCKEGMMRGSSVPPVPDIPKLALTLDRQQLQQTPNMKKGPAGNTSRFNPVEVTAATMVEPIVNSNSGNGITGRGDASPMGNPSYNQPTLPLNNYNQPTLPLNNYNQPTLPLNNYNQPTLPLNNYNQSQD